MTEMLEDVIGGREITDSADWRQLREEKMGTGLAVVSELYRS